MKCNSDCRDDMNIFKTLQNLYKKIITPSPEGTMNSPGQTTDNTPRSNNYESFRDSDEFQRGRRDSETKSKYEEALDQLRNKRDDLTTQLRSSANAYSQSKVQKKRDKVAKLDRILKNPDQELSASPYTFFGSETDKYIRRAAFAFQKTPTQA